MNCPEHVYLRFQRAVLTLYPFEPSLNLQFDTHGSMIPRLCDLDE
jgi:hypothetical protein